MDFQNPNMTFAQSMEVSVLLAHLRTYVDATDNIMSDFHLEFDGARFCTTGFALRRLANAEQRNDTALGQLRRAIGISLGQPGLVGLPGESRLMIAFGRAPGSADQRQYERQTKVLIQSWLCPFLFQIVQVINIMSLELDLIRGWFADHDNTCTDVDPRNLPTNRHGRPVGILGIREFEFEEHIDCISVFSTKNVRNRLPQATKRMIKALVLFTEWTAHAFHNGNMPNW